MHCFGLAVDVNHDTNPFVGLIKGKPEFKDNRSPRIIERAMRLLHGEKFNVDKRLKPPADDKSELGAGAAWDIHHRASETLAQYLRLADDVNGQRVQTLVAADQSRGHTDTLEWWKRRIATDRSVLRYWDFQHHPNPQQLGYMDLSRDLVVALVGAGLMWGGQYREAKDMMHFDLPGIITRSK